MSDIYLNKISDFGIIVTGSTPPTNNSLYWNGDFNFYSPADFNDNAYCEKTDKTITKLGLSQGREIPENSIMVTCIASIGKIAINKSIGLTNQQINTIIPSDKYDFKYIYYLLSHNTTKIKGIAAQTTIPILNKTDFGKFQLLATDDKSKQKKIAQILTTCDTVIEQTQAAIEKYKAIKQGMLHDLFTRGLTASGQLRPTPQQAPELYKQSELGLIPKEWEVKRLEECCIGSCSYGINAPAVDFESNLPLYLRITDITENGEYNKYNRKCVNDLQSDNYVLMDGDIVFARTGATVGKTYLYKPEDGKLIYAGFLIKFSPDRTKLNSYFLKSYTETGNYWNWVSANSLRSGQPGINGNEYSSMKIAFPPIEEQNEISNKLKSIDTKLQSEEALLSKYQSIKKGLMSDLLSGKREV